MSQMMELLPVSNHEEWSQINAWIREQLRFPEDSKMQVRSYTSGEAAVIDQLLTFAQFYSHKKTMYFHRGATPLFEEIIPFLLRDTFKVQSLTMEENLKTSALQEEVMKSLSADTGCVVLCANHWGTKEKFQLQTLVQALEAKRIHTVIINHGDQELMMQPPGLFTCFVHQWGKLNFAVMGSRWKNPTLLSWQGTWNKTEFQNSWNELSKRKTDISLIKNFEATFSGESFPIAPENRLSDRAMLLFKDLNAEALAEGLAHAYGWRAEEKNRYTATLNSCEKDVYPAFRQWWRPEPDPVVVRGLLQISVEALARHSDFAAKLQAVAQSLRQTQTWAVP